MIDAWDIIGAAGALLVVGGLAAWSVPLACVVAGLSMCGLYYLAEKRR